VADGTVTEAKDGIPENTPSPTERAVEMTLDSMAGNHIIEKIGNGAYATYAHMQPGSLRVKLGDHVKKGQTLGLVGNSGNSTGPHLHFQICDANSVFACQGLPYAFSSFESVGEWKPGSQPVKHTMEIPIEGEVVNFDSGDHKTSAAASLKPHQ
jgi:murein DD-endopeptidase MepM/ murein hydrolase activator NlpD